MSHRGEGVEQAKGRQDGALSHTTPPTRAHTSRRHLHSIPVAMHKMPRYRNAIPDAPSAVMLHQGLASGHGTTSFTINPLSFGPLGTLAATEKKQAGLVAQGGRLPGIRHSCRGREEPGLRWPRSLRLVSSGCPPCGRWLPFRSLLRWAGAGGRCLSEQRGKLPRLHRSCRHRCVAVAGWAASRCQ